MLEVYVRTDMRPDAGWHYDFDDNVTTDAVLDLFCAEFYLDTRSCSLHFQGRQLRNQLLRKVPNKSGGKPFHLAVEVQEPTLVFLLGNTWSLGTDGRILTQTWQNITIALSAAATYAATVMSDIEAVWQLVKCKPTDILPSAVAHPILTASALESAPAASRLLLLLSHELTSANAVPVAGPQLHDLLKLQAEMLQRHLKAHPGTELAVCGEQEPVLALMRCAILLLKLIHLTPNLSVSKTARSALWGAVSTLAKSFRDHIDAYTASTRQQGQGRSRQWQLSQVLATLIVEMLRHPSGQASFHADIWQTPDAVAPTACFRLLAGLVAWPSTQSMVLGLVCQRVALAHIAKGLVQAKPLALEAYRLLSCILAVPMQPVARHKKILGVLAEMQGVRRLSNLLCPTLDSKGSPEFASACVVYKSKTVVVKSAGDQEDSNKDLLPVATVIGALLYAYPYPSIIESPTLGDCYQLINPGFAPYPSAFDSGSDSCSSDWSEDSSNTSTEERSDSPCQDESTQPRDNLHDEHSSNALHDLHTPELTAINHCQTQTESSGPSSAGQPQPTAQAGTFSWLHGEATSQSVWDVTLCMECTDSYLQRLTSPVWDDAQTVALRALFTLDWVAQHAGHTQLMQVLVKIAHALLVAHATDPRPDMTSVLKSGLGPVLNVLSHSESLDVVSATCLRHLARLFLRRVSTDRLAFQALYGDRASGVLGHSSLDQPGLRQLARLLRDYDATAENAARPPLLLEYIQAVYLLPACTYGSSPLKINQDRATPGVPLGAATSYFTATGYLALIQEAMLTPHPLDMRLTSCACLFRLWADAFHNEEGLQVPVGLLAWLEEAAASTESLQCFQAGLQAVLTGSSSEPLLLTSNMVGLARVLFQAKPMVSQLFQMAPEPMLEIVQLVTKVLAVCHLQGTSDPALQAQLLQACLLFLEDANAAYPESTQSLHEVLADATQHWCTPWPPPQIADPSCSWAYVDAGLPECRADTVCSELVRFIIQAPGANTGEEARESLQKAVVSCMLWLQSVGRWQFQHCQPEGPMSLAYNPLVQSLTLMSECMKIEEAAAAELPGWSPQLPTQTLQAVLQLLFVHIGYMCCAYRKAELETDAMAQTLAMRKLLESPAGRRPYITAQDRITIDEAEHETRDKCAMAKTLIECMLDQLQRIQEHAVWGPALALLATDGWCADQKVYTQLDGYIKSIAAEGMLENARLQQLGNIFCWKSGLLPWEAKLKSGPATGCEQQPPATPEPQRSLESREAAARKAAKQLLAEEEADAAKAAAKKAKKQKQKVKKQQAKGSQHSVDLEDAASLGPSTPALSAQMQAVSISAASHSGSQASAAGDECGQSPFTQDPSVQRSALAKPAESETVPTEDSSSVFPGAQDSLAQQGSDNGNSGGLGAIHRLLCCPLTKVIMVDPVVAADGHTYERAAFQEWLLHSFMSPVDKTPLKHTRLVSNQAIKNALAIQRAQA